jgi:hypothetical protein
MKHAAYYPVLVIAAILVFMAVLLAGTVGL